MRLWDPYRRKQRRIIEDPDELIAALCEAVATRDEKQFVDLCDNHFELILEHFPRWQKRSDLRSLSEGEQQSYLDALVTVARYFGENLGQPKLLELLMPADDDNPLARWDRAFEKGYDLAVQCRFQKAIGVLSDLLIDIDRSGVTGPGVGYHQSRTEGFLGECHFQNGDSATAREMNEHALAVCQSREDVEGVTSCRQRLLEFYRYEGEPDLAACCATELSEVLDRQDREEEARRLRKRAEIIRGGEPLLRPVLHFGGRVYELEEPVIVREGSVQVVFERNRITRMLAEKHLAHGKELGSDERYEEALVSFRAAAEADRFDPDPSYQEGFALLHLGRHAEAVESFERTERLAPGWYSCRS